MTKRTELEIEDARQLLRGLLSRRDFVYAGVVAGIGVMGLAGCTSSPTTNSTPDDSMPVGSIPIGGTVVLPAGSTLSLTSLALKVLGQTVPLTSATTFAAGVSPNAPTLALVTDANGNGILAGFLDPTLGGSQTITAHSTGIALCWFALGAPFLPASLKSQVLALLAADPAMDTLQSVIAQRIAAVPLAVVNADTQIAAALNSAVATLTADTPALAAAVTTPANETLTITPATDQGGVSVSKDTTITGINLANYYRRQLKAYVYETSTLTAGTATNISPTRLAAGPFDIGEPSAFTPVGGLRSLLGNSGPFKSFTIDTIPLPLDAGSDATTYEIVVIGPSATGVVPAFFGAPRYAGQVAAWNTAIADLFSRTYYADLVYATLLEISGFGSIFPASPNLVTAAVKTQKFAGKPFSGSVGQGLPSSPQTLGSSVSTTVAALNADLGLTTQYKSTAPTIMDTVEAAALKKVNSIDWQASIKSGSDFLLKLGSPFSNYKANGALGKLLSNLAHADAGLLWTVVVGKGQATITPPNPAVVAGESETLHLVLSSDMTSTYEFNWTSSSVTATFAAEGEAGGAEINTQKATVDLLTTGADIAPITVTVVVYDIANGHKLFVTRVTAVVAIIKKAIFSPASAVLSIGDHQTFVVSVAGQLPAGVKYLWTNVGGAGSIGTANVVTTSVPSIAYTAVSKGNDTLSVQVADASDHLLAKGSVDIEVEPELFIKFDVSGTWATGTAPANGHYTFGDYVGVRQAGNFTVDALLAEFDRRANPGGLSFTNGVTLLLAVPTGGKPTPGQVFTKVVAGQPTPGQFVLSLSLNLSDPLNAGTLAPGNSGTLTITSVTTLSDGSISVPYTFSVSNGAGGTISGSGVARWV